MAGGAGADGPGHAHRDVAARRRPRPTSKRCAAAASPCWSPPSGRLTGADSGPGRLPEPEAIFEAAIALAGAPAVPATPAAAVACAAPPGPAAGTAAGRAHRHRQRRRHPRTAGPGPVPRQPVLRQAGRGPGQSPRATPVRESPAAGRAHGSPGSRTASNWSEVETALELREGRAACGRRIRRHHHGRGRRRLPSGGCLRHEDQEARRRRRSRHLPGPQSGHPAGARGGPRRRLPEPADRRLRGRDGRRRRRRPGRTPRPSCGARPATCWWSTRWARTRSSARTRNSVVILSRSGAEPQEAPVPRPTSRLP